MTERVRHSNQGKIDLGNRRLPEFLNPFSYMSSDEARVALELWQRNVPWTYRYFDGEAPTCKMLIPDFAPEFTLSEYKTVIMVEAGFGGVLPGVITKAALAKVCLEHDGWKVIILFESDIMHNLTAELDRQFPESVHPLITGGEKPSPFGVPHFMFTRRQFLKGLALLRTRFAPRKVEINHDSTRTRRKFLRERTGDSGRTRSLRSRYQQVVE